MFPAFKRSESMGAVIKHFDIYQITQLTLIRMENNIIWTCSVGPVTSLSVAFILFAKKVAIDFCQFFSHLLRILLLMNL